VKRVWAVLLVAVAACSPGGSQRGASDPTGTARPNLAHLREGILRDALESTTGPPAIDPAEVVDGGVGVDGIPPIDRPDYLDEATAGRDLVDTEPVALVTVGPATHVYPLRVMTRHEIVNDVIGGVPVTVTFCPLCNSTVAYRRELAGTTYDFGVSGLLYRSALVMYDRQTSSLWTHFDGRAVAGRRTGARLDVVPSSIVSWAAARRDFPALRVVVAEGAGLGAARNPYVGYDTARTPFLFRGDPDPRLRATERVVGVVIGGVARAYPFELLRARRVVQETVSGQRLVILFDPAVRSALDSADITEARQVGGSGVFAPSAGGRALTFTPAGADFVDQETGSRWSVNGRAVSGPLAGEQLEPVPHLDAFWFAWAAYNPATQVAQ